MAKKRDIYTMSNGELVTEGSVSEISNGLLHMPFLVPWAAKETVKALAGDKDTPGLWQPNRAYTAKEIEAALYEAKGAHRRKKDTAGDIGTEIHSIVGAYVEGQLLPEHIKNDDHRRGLENFMKVTKDWEWLGSEVTLINEWYECGCGNCPRNEILLNGKWRPTDGIPYAFGCPNKRLCGYGGTADGLARLPSGMVILPDFKTSNHIAATYSVQCMMYAEATPVGDAAGLADVWREIKETRILHFNKELLTWEVLERSIDDHRPYLPHFIGCARWNKKFNHQSFSTKDDAVKVSPTGETTFRSTAPLSVPQDAPAPSVWLG